MYALRAVKFSERKVVLVKKDGLIKKQNIFFSSIKHLLKKISIFIDL